MSEPGAGLAVASDTGIDVSLPLAGPGARSLAFIVDWHIRLVLALAWFVAGAVLVNGTLSFTVPPGHLRLWLGALVFPALAIYLLYHPVVETVMRGRTPGKRYAGIRVVNRGGGPPGIGALLLRNVFRLIDSLPVAYGVGLTLMLLTRDGLRCGDMAAGTLMVYERPGTDPQLLRSAALRTGELDAAGAEIAAELLERWSTLMPEARVRLTHALLRRYQGKEADLSDTDELTWRARLEQLARPGGT